MSAKFLTRVKRSFKPNDQKHSKSEYRSNITRDLLSRSARFAADASPHVYHIDEETVVKTGDGVRLQEAATMQFVRDRTSIPVPRILDSFVRNENQHACIVMEYVKGETLGQSLAGADRISKDFYHSRAEGLLGTAEKHRGFFHWLHR